MNLDLDLYSYRISPSQLVVGDVVPGVGTVAAVLVLDDPRWSSRVTWTDGGSTLYKPKVRVQCERVEAEIALMRELRNTVNVCIVEASQGTTQEESNGLQDRQHARNAA